MNEFRCPIVGDTAVTLAADNSIEFKGVTYKPNSTRSYISFSVSTAFPKGITSYGTGLWSDVIARSYETLLHQSVNREHRRKVWDKTKEDQTIGTILAVDFPQGPVGGKWRMSDAASPCITGIASCDKLATAVQPFIGEQLAGRHQFSVSMEVLWKLDDAGFAVNSGGKGLFKDTTPDHFAQAGWDYVPYKEAPKGLQSLFRDGAVKGKWKNHPTAILMGGLDGAVHYAGLGVVRYGAEPTAKINRLTASGEGPFMRLVEAARKVSQPC